MGIQTIEFSGPTYQIEVIDQGESFWPFLQFDEEGTLNDAFCSCGSEETCPHLSAAFLAIYNGKPDPLHIRFQNSFWNHLCLLFFDYFGSKPQKKYQEEEHEFKIQPKNQKGKTFLHSLIEKRPKETPENSLKFSSLSQDEIAHWKEGRASNALRFELSFWSDLAKHLMLIQESGTDYTISFEEIHHLPLKITIETKNITLFFQLERDDLPKLIPHLSTVNSPLKVYWEGENGLESISYDNISRSFSLQYGRSSLDVRMGVVVGAWSYVSGDGFYSLSTKPSKTTVSEEEIPAYLTANHEEVSQFIPVHTKPIQVAYHLAFDHNWRWHIEGYLFEKGDLEKEHSALFDSWAYLEGKGFYAILPPLFETPSQIIEPEDVSSFIHYHRNFLNTTSGFSIHLASVESAVTYQITPKGSLLFLNKFAEESLEMKDFGDWVYYKGQGFFPKKTTGFTSVLFARLEVQPRDISSFIRLHTDELETIANFFAPQVPLKKRGLKLVVRDEKTIEIEPESELIDEYDSRPFHFYGNYVYVEGVGFSELPASMRLPVRFQEKMVFQGEEIVDFFKEEFETIHSFFTFIDPRAEAPHKLELRISSLEKESHAELAINGKFISEKGEVSLKEIWSAQMNQGAFLFSEAGRIDLHDERFTFVHNMKEGRILTTLDFLRLDIVEGIYTTNPQVNSLLQELRTMTSHEEPVLAGLQSHLRLYQKTGLEWLWFLYHNGLSGLLCDEMGLGKTHQAMALISAILNQKKGKKCRFLIVAPTSVIYHWQEKLQTFLPELNVHFFHGLKRSLKGLPKAGILLTSYGILRAEKKAIEKISFELAIFDEIQMAKNPSSRLFEALSKVKAQMRIGLTGTPIENYLRELKALFDLVLPGYMPSEKEFRETFVLPIEKEGNAEKKVLLSRLIKPFILRRKKKEVLQELPEKSEDKILCDLSEEQLQLYSSVLERERKMVVDQLKNESGPIPYVHIFSIISKLKQICDHPALALKEPERYHEHTSGKWDLFVELLREALEGEQKVVVFSQYLQMLEIIETYLQEQKISYAQIRGDTLDRKAQMDQFRDDPRCQVFLGSLGAAGVGIDLTSASIVILYDRWWNAAKENQAIDRVHRIGQKWAVQVYKLISKGSVEEKIDLMITRKGQLMEEIVTADDESTIKRFTREELLDLLTFNPKIT